MNRKRLSCLANAALGVFPVFLSGPANAQMSTAPPDAQAQYPTSEHDQRVSAVESFDQVLEGWERRARTGNIMSTYDAQVIATYDPGEPRFEPQPGKTYFYENLGTSTVFYSAGRREAGVDGNQVVVGDAETKEVIASYTLASELRSSMHTTFMTPDARYVYIIGAPFGEPSGLGGLAGSASLVKVDALTLQPVKQINVGGRVHHGQIFRDEYLLIDTFGRDDDGLDLFLLDPETDQVIGGVRDEDLGGATYTAYTDDDYIYVLMEPVGYGPMSLTGYIGAVNLGLGRVTALRSFWVSRIDPDTWEVVDEYPYPGYRGDWILIDDASEYIYVPGGGSHSLSKVELATGDIAWHRSTGIGPYGASFNADQSEIWVADKGEANGFFGRTLTVFDTATGNPLETLFSGYVVDHVLLSPNGREMWATANGDAQIFVYDAATREQTHVIDMPNWGEPHGLVWVHYDAGGNPRVVRDQGGFRGGIDPVAGIVLDY